MPNLVKVKVLDEIRRGFGDLRKLKGSESLFVIGHDAAHIYFRYSKVHKGGRTFFGLREADLRQLEGHNSFLCFLLDDGSPPLLVPYADFEEVFANAEPAGDGQYKVQLLSPGNALELYIAKQGRFNVEGYVGLQTLKDSLDARELGESCTLTHSQIQTLLAAIGHAKGFEVRVPDSDVGRLDWSLTGAFGLRRDLPAGFEKVKNAIQEIDVAWIVSGRNKIAGLYEVEHSTPVYSGLLRFNDILLADPSVSRFSIVANQVRREAFSRQLFRQTFKKSGLSELCSFLEYPNVLAWHRRLFKGGLSAESTQ